MQVDPIRPTLKAPETKPLLNFDESLSIFGFDFSLRRYNVASTFGLKEAPGLIGKSATRERQGL